MAYILSIRRAVMSERVSVQMVEVPGKALEGNPLGDPAVREQPRCLLRAMTTLSIALFLLFPVHMCKVLRE